MNRKHIGPRVWAGLTLACGTILAWPFLRQTNELSQARVTSGGPWSASAPTSPQVGTSAATSPGSDSAPSPGWPLAPAGSEPSDYLPAWASKRTHLDELISGENPTSTFEALEIPAHALLPELQAWRNELQAANRPATQPSSTHTGFGDTGFGDTALGLGDTGFGDTATSQLGKPASASVFPVGAANAVGAQLRSPPRQAAGLDTIAPSSREEPLMGTRVPSGAGVSPRGSSGVSPAESVSPMREPQFVFQPGWKP